MRFSSGLWVHPMIELLFKLYGLQNHRLRGLIRSLVLRMEGGEIYSPTIRRIFKTYYDVEIGMYTHGGCFVPGALDRHTTWDGTAPSPLASGP